LKHNALCLTLALLAASPALIAQTIAAPRDLQFSSNNPAPTGTPQPTLNVKKNATAPQPFSRLALSGGIGIMGVKVQAAVNANRYIELRGTGNYFNYSTNFTSNGINATAKLNLASAGASVDFFPFPNHGFRLSPGAMFYNQNQLAAATNVPAGSSFTLNGTTYYSANANSATGATPVVGTGALGLDTNKAAFTFTTGWGNMTPHNGHWSFPFEIGAAFIGAPTVNVNLTGWACYDKAQTECANLASTTNPVAIAIQSNLTAQVAKWNSDLNPLKTFPIVSFGVAYSFRIR
jgi:hypothetical protein